MEPFVVDWEEFKGFFSRNVSSIDLEYIEIADKYRVKMLHRGFVISLKRDLLKGDSDTAEFEAQLKPHGNISRATRTRMTTCRIGRRSNYRYISFTTAKDQQFDNTDYKEQDFGDVTYTMLDSSGLPTTDNALARETHISFMPTYDFEVSGGLIDIPTDLGSVDLDLWELHVVGAPKIPQAYGGEFPFFANSRLKFNRGMRVGMDESLNPAEVSGEASPYAREILIVIKHPLGAQREFQIMIKVFREPIV